MSDQQSTTEQSTVNLATLQCYRDLAKTCTVDEAREIMAQSLYHLQVVLHSRNSYIEGPVHIDRGPAVEAMHREANQFLDTFQIRLPRG